MTSPIEEFWSQERFAVVGASRRRDKFGNSLFREMKKRGMSVVAVNRHADTLEGERSFENLKKIPGKVDAAIIVVPPKETDIVLRQCADCGISHVWIQQGAESDRSRELANELGLTAVFDECALMFMEPVTFPHSVHHWIHTRFGKHHRVPVE